MAPAPLRDVAEPVGGQAELGEPVAGPVAEVTTVGLVGAVVASDLIGCCVATGAWVDAGLGVLAGAHALAINESVTRPATRITSGRTPKRRLIICVFSSL